MDSPAGGCQLLRGALAGGLAAAIVWWPALLAPFWQEDYAWLAQCARGLAWPGIGETLLPGDALFWRPLSVSLWWKFSIWLSGGSAVLVHIMGLVLHAAACAAVGWFAAGWARMAGFAVGMSGAFFAAFLFGIHPAHALPVHWAAGRTETFALLFSGAALGSWVALLQGRRAAMAASAAVVCFAAALLSKEGTIILPALALAVWWSAGRARLSRGALATLLAWGMTAGIYLVLRAEATTPPVTGSPYEMAPGVNVPRNAALLGAFALGLPRDATMGQPVMWWAWAWAAACLATQGAAMVLAIRAIRGQASRRLMTGLAAFFLIAAAPYLALRWNCYPYYTLMGLMAWGVVAAIMPPRRTVVVSLTMASAILTMLGMHLLPYPSTLATARRAAEVHKRLGEMRRDAVANEVATQFVVAVEVADRRVFLFAGWEEGVAAVLGREPDQVRVVEPGAGGRDGPAPLRIP